ncbi:MAG: alpha/beta fold hydrolase [Ilumatobacteraceae bacterium]
MDPRDVETCDLHGRTVAYRQSGTGPVVVLIHGLAGTMHTWDGVVERLSTTCTVLALDLPGHGRSAAPGGDYSLGAYASGVRDLLDVLGHRGATVVGHSLGGGIAMQFAYQYPERCERLVLVSSGGLGTEVSIALRAAALPGTEHLVSLIAHRYVIAAGTLAGRLAAAVGVRADASLVEAARAYATLADGEIRQSFFHTLRNVVDGRGQRVSATDRLYLMNEIPSLVVWGTDDRIIPVDHAHRARAALPHSGLELFERAGHFPHVADPGRFVEAIHAFVGSSRPAVRTRPARPRSDGRRLVEHGPAATAAG